MDTAIIPPVAATFTGACLGGLLLAAGAAKALDRSAFADVLRDGGIVPASTTRVVATGITSAELIVGGALFLGIGQWAMALAAASLFGLFAAGTVVMVARGRTAVPCGCFGVDPRKTVNIGMVARTTALGVLAAGASWMLSTSPGVAPSVRFGALAGAWVVVAGIAVAHQVYLAADGAAPRASQIGEPTREAE